MFHPGFNETNNYLSECHRDENSNISLPPSAIFSQESCDYDSDHISSDVEVELYSQIHHERVPDQPIPSFLSLEKRSSGLSSSSVNTIRKSLEANKKSICEPSSSNIETTKLHVLHETPAKKFKSRTKHEERNQNPNWTIIGPRQPEPNSHPTSVVQSVSFSLANNLGLSKMSDTECEIIRIGPEEKKVPVITISEKSAVSDTDSDCVVLEHSVFSQSNDVKLNLMDETEVITKKKSRKGKKKKLGSTKKEKNKEKKLKRIKKRKLAEGSPWDWKIDPIDKYPDYFKRTPTYRRQSALNRVQCHNCRCFGHLSKNCTSSRKYITCYLCGLEGHHGDSCLNPICPKCLVIGHSLRYCLWDNEYLRVECPICKSPGHLREECPDMQRRFHLSTTTDNIVKSSASAKSHRKRWCYNCGRKGHFGFDCSQKRIEAYVFPSDLTIKSYENPLDDLPTSENGNEKTSKREELKLRSLFQHKYKMAREANERFSRSFEIPPLKQLRTMGNPGYYNIRKRKIETSESRSRVGESSKTVDEFVIGGDHIGSQLNPNLPFPTNGAGFFTPNNKKTAIGYNWLDDMQTNQDLNLNSSVDANSTPKSKKKSLKGSPWLKKKSQEIMKSRKESDGYLSKKDWRYQKRLQKLHNNTY